LVKLIRTRGTLEDKEEFTSSNPSPRASPLSLGEKNAVESKPCNRGLQRLLTLCLSSSKRRQEKYPEGYCQRLTEQAN
jgi:hypothetical protein